jgi:hypothetical protein
MIPDRRQRSFGALCESVTARSGTIATITGRNPLDPTHEGLSVLKSRGVGYSRRFALPIAALLFLILGAPQPSRHPATTAR